MTTLYSATGLGSTLTVECDGDIVNLTAFSSAETCRAWANPKRADLLAALDAVPRVPEQPPLADRERDLLGPQNDDGRYWHGRAMENLRKAELATSRAEKAEAKLAEAATQRDEFEDRYETSHASRMHAEECYRREHDRAEKAEAERDALAATVERIKARVESSPSRYLKAQLQECLDPKPAFVLPTEVPARIEASDANGPHHLVLWTDGENLLWHSSVDGDDYSPEEVGERFTGHRLLDGAE